jgi:hypothetical protein
MELGVPDSSPAFFKTGHTVRARRSLRRVILLTIAAIF